MKVLNFGSLNIDYVYQVDHFVQKGETLSSSRLDMYSGGKGMNQSLALTRAGAEVYHAGAVGADGTFLIEMLEASGVHTDYIQVKDDVRTGNAVIQNDIRGDNCILLYSGANYSITEEQADEVISAFSEGDCLMLQNEINQLDYITKRAKEQKMKIVLNPSPINQTIFDLPLECIDYFILNEIEGKMLSGTGETDPEKILDLLSCKYPDTEIVLTLGEAGSIYRGHEGTIYQKAYQVDTVDTTAAGDTFAGYYIAGRIRQYSVRESLDLAAKASAIAVTQKGAAPSIPWMQDVLEFSRR